MKNLVSHKDDRSVDGREATGPDDTQSGKALVESPPAALHCHGGDIHSELCGYLKAIASPVGAKKPTVISCVCQQNIVLRY